MFFGGTGTSYTYGFPYPGIDAVIGTDPEGDWILQFTDYAAGNVGKLYFVQITLYVDDGAGSTPTPIASDDNTQDSFEEDSAINIKAGILPLLSLF